MKSAVNHSLSLLCFITLALAPCNGQCDINPTTLAGAEEANLVWNITFSCLEEHRSECEQCIESSIPDPPANRFNLEDNWTPFAKAIADEIYEHDCQKPSDIMCGAWKCCAPCQTELEANAACVVGLVAVWLSNLTDSGVTSATCQEVNTDFSQCFVTKSSSQTVSLALICLTIISAMALFLV